MLEEYTRVCRDNLLSYGGNQLWSDSSSIRKCGCGPVAALDLTLYLSRRRSIINIYSEDLDDGVIPLPSYNKLLRRVCGKYFPIVPPFGINGVALAFGLNRLLRDADLPYRANWCFSGKRILERIVEMLKKNIPVILAIGQNFPKVWKNTRLDLYGRTVDGSYKKTGATKAHYVSITGIDGEWLRISSWGKVYYVNFLEFKRYASESSLHAVCNIVYISEI